ncbi:MAG: hypothetical protein ABJ251_04780 [Paracoccaceae bacterium]
MTVSVPAKSAPVNDRIGDTRRVGTTNVPRLRGNAASAKYHNQMTALSAEQA